MTTSSYFIGDPNFGYVEPTDSNLNGWLAVMGTTLIVTMQRTIANSNDTGLAGEICHDSDYIYVCVATDTWKRVAISTW